jgi:hypothetical protein
MQDGKIISVLPDITGMIWVQLDEGIRAAPLPDIWMD